MPALCALILALYVRATPHTLLYIIDTPLLDTIVIFDVTTGPQDICNAPSDILLPLLDLDIAEEYPRG